MNSTHGLCAGELYSLAEGFGSFFRGFEQALEKGMVLFLVSTSTSPSLQAYAELGLPTVGAAVLSVQSSSSLNGPHSVCPTAQKSPYPELQLHFPMGGGNNKITANPLLLEN